MIIRNTATNETRTTTTNDSGFYAFPSVIPGTYDVTITHAGFKKAEVTGRVAQVSESAQVDVTLEVGQTSRIGHRVRPRAPSYCRHPTRRSGGVLQSRLVNDIPLNGRNFFDLATMLPHVSLQNNGSQLSFAGFASNAVLGNNTSSQLFRPTGIFAAGNRDSATNVSIDGVNIQSSVYRQATIQQPPSAIEEVKIHVSSTNAEVGNGVAAVNVITESGSNQWHGEAYEYFRNDKLDANYFFSNLSGRAKAPYRQNQYGAAGCAGLSTTEKGGNAFASYLLGTSLNGLFQLNAAAYRGHKRYYGAYVQDSWRVSQRLTLNDGLRYEYWARGSCLVTRLPRSRRRRRNTVRFAESAGLPQSKQRLRQVAPLNSNVPKPAIHKATRTSRHDLAEGYIRFSSARSLTRN